MKSLYLLTTAGLGKFHVIAEDPTEAQNALVKIFNEQKYGTTDDRRVVNIEWVSGEFGEALHDKEKPFLSDKSRRLFIVSDWK